MPRLTQKEKLYCFYMGIVEEKNKKGNYYMRIVGKIEKAPNRMPFKILLGISNLRRSRKTKYIKNFIEAVKRGDKFKEDNHKVMQYYKLCVLDYKKCCENFKSEFMGFEDEQMVQKINKLIFKMQHKDITNMIEDYVNSDEFQKENAHLM
jgi:hypothetical protein